MPAECANFVGRHVNVEAKLSKDHGMVKLRGDGGSAVGPCVHVPATASRSHARTHARTGNERTAQLAYVVRSPALQTNLARGVLVDGRRRRRTGGGVLVDGRGRREGGGALP